MFGNTDLGSFELLALIPFVTQDNSSGNKVIGILPYSLSTNQTGLLSPICTLIHPWLWCKLPRNQQQLCTDHMVGKCLGFVRVLSPCRNLCDIQKNGKLNAEQFALAMHLVAERVRGKEPPKDLTAAMIPPSLRKQQQQPPAQPSQPSQPSSTVWAPTPFTSTPPLLPTSTPPLLPTPASTTQLPTSSVAISSTTATTSIATTATSGGSGGGTFTNDFSAIMELDGIANEIESIRK